MLSPYEAGEAINTHLTTCTAGFALKNQGAQIFWATTAGHCSRINQSTDIGGTGLGPVEETTFFGQPSGQADAARVKIPEVHARPPRVFTGGGGHRSVTGKYGNDALIIGLRLCFQGASSGADNCGNIVRRDVDLPPGCADNHCWSLNHAWCIDFAGLGGDSGGPVYHVRDDGSARAAGLVHGDGGVSGHTCFSSIVHVENALNRELLAQ